MTRRESVPPAPAEGAPGDPLHSLRWKACAIGAGVTFGTIGIFSTLFYDAGGTRFTLLVLRFWGASVLLVAIVLARGRPRPAGRDAVVSALLGAGMLGATFSLLAGFEQASPGLVTLLFYVYPLLVTVAAHGLFGDVLGRRRATLLGIGLAGIALTVGIPREATAAGIGWGLAAGVCTAAYLLGSRYVLARTVDPFQFSALAFGAGAVALVPVAAVVGLDRPSGEAAGWALGLVVLSTVVPMLLLYSAIRRIGPGAAARLATVEPVTAVVLSYLVLGDALRATQIAGGIVVVVSVVLLATPSGAGARRGRATVEPAAR